MTSGNERVPQKPMILGKSNGLSDEEAAGITQMIQEAQHSARQQTIPTQDLDASATTTIDRKSTRLNSSH